MEPMTLPGPKSRALIKRDSSVVSPSYSRPYPFVMDHGKGSEVWDVDGNRFLDFMAGIAVTSTGHAHPNVVRAIQEQAAEFIHISSDFYHVKMIELAEKLNEVAPFDEAAVSFLTNSGTEASRRRSSWRATTPDAPISSASPERSMGARWER